MKRYKAAILAAFLEPDTTAKKVMSILNSANVKTFVVPEGGYTADFMNKFATESGAYVATKPGLQVDMNGDFISVHCIVPGVYDFKLPFACNVVNVKSGKHEAVADRIFKLNLTAGETCWFRLKE